MKKITLSVEGMTCSACSSGLEKYLCKQEGINSASVNLVMSNVVIEYDNSILNQSDLDLFIKKAGFKSLGEFKEVTIYYQTKKDKNLLLFSCFLAIILLFFDFGQMFNFFVINTNIFVVIQILLAIYFIFYGFDILKSGYKNLINGIPNMDSLISIGVSTSFLYSLYNSYLIFRGNSSLVMNLYFEATGIVIFFVKLGRYIDKNNMNKTTDVFHRLVEITPEKAILKVNDREEVVTLDEIKKGDILTSKPGEKIAVDGEIIYGKAHFDESFITGESTSVLKSIGDMVNAGSINYDGYIEYKALRIGKDSIISEIVRLVTEATNSKIPIARLADKISGYFVKCIFILAFVTFFAYLIWGSSFERALLTFVTVLVVACPCSLGLASPLTVVMSEGLCTSMGILVKNSEVLERVSKIDAVLFDKTGTLTYGSPRISKIINYSKMSEKEILKIVGSIEIKSNHPIASAFVNYLKENNIKSYDVFDFKSIDGLGVSARIDNDIFLLGNAKMLSKYKINSYNNDELDLSNCGNSIVYVVKNNEVIALIGINDVLRKEAKKVINLLKDYGLDVIMLTGDNNLTSKRIANDIGIEHVISDVVPKEKGEIVKKLKNEGHLVMMCGDGINDSLALTYSDIGVSLSSGTDIAVNSADVILIRNNLLDIIKFIDISKKTIRNIKQNLFWAFFYNSLMIPIAMGLFKRYGLLLNPVLACMAMVISSITVTLNALSLKWKVK